MDVIDFISTSVGMEAQVVDHHLEPWHKLHGKVVMVTGASSGLGQDFCLDLSKAGCKIVAVARWINHLFSLCDQINQFRSSEEGGAGTFTAVMAELNVCADGPTIDKSVQKAWDAFGHIDA